MNKDYYINLRNQFTPPSPKLIFIAESPPASGKYFYDQGGRVLEPLFSNLIEVTLGYKPTDKPKSLKEFCDKGYLLIDATYITVNKIDKKKDRNKIILNSYNSLKSELEIHNNDYKIPLILIKKNICELLNIRLTNDNYCVANDGIIIPFPAFGHQLRFRKIVIFILHSLNSGKCPRLCDFTDR
jgi:hypothetical protein